MTPTRLLLIVLSLACVGGARAPAPTPTHAPAANPLAAHVLAPEKRAPGERFPLVIYLHGLGGSGMDALEAPALSNLARHARMFVVAPDGGTDSEGRHFWNAGGACCNFDRSAVDDVGRLTTLIDHWRGRPEIDPRRVYIVGFSNGGFMAHRLACRIGDRLTAVVSIAGAGVDKREPCAVSSPIAIVEVHGDSDPIVNYSGGRVFDSPRLAVHPSAQQTIADWAARLRCTPQAPRKDRPAATITTDSTGPCPLGTAELWTITLGGHHLINPDILSKVTSFLKSQVKPPPNRP